MARKNNNFDKSRVSKVKMPNIGSWLTNAGKSIGLAAFDVIQDIMPATTDIVTNASEQVQNVKQHLVEFKAQQGKLKDAFQRNIFFDIANTAKDNVVDALKTGTLYHPIGSGSDDEFDFNLEDDNYGFNFDDDQWGDTDGGGFDAGFESEDGQTKVRTKAQHKGSTTVNDIDVSVNVGEDSSLVNAINSQTQVSLATARDNIELQKTISANQLNEFSRLHESMNSYMGSMDSNISTIAQEGVSTLSQHATVSAKYYNDSIELFTKISETLQSIKDTGIGTANQDSKVDFSKYKNALDLFDGNGFINIPEYFETVLEQGNKALDRNFITSTIKMMLSDKDALKEMLGKPIDSFVTNTIKKIIGTSLEEAGRSFDEMLQSATFAGLYRIRSLQYSTNPIFQMIGETFGLGNKLKTSVDKSNYNRGKMDWNGQSHKTLNEVIPYYLRKMTAILTGTQEIAYDYDKGTFNTVSEIVKSYKETDEKKLLGGLNSVISDFKDSLSDVQFTAIGQSEQLMEDMTKLMTSLVRKDGTSLHLDTVAGRDSFQKSIAEAMGRPQTDPAVQIISSFFDSRGHAYTTKAFTEMQASARNEYTKHKLREESGELGTSGMYVDTGVDGLIDSHMDKLNKTKINSSASVFGSVDKFGVASVDYLRDIYKLLGTGIKVYDVGGAGYYGSTPSQDVDKIKSASISVANTVEERNKKLNTTNENIKKSNKKNRVAYKPEDIKKGEAKGKVKVDYDDSYDGGRNLVSGDLRDKMYATRIKNEKAEDDEKVSLFNKLTGINSDQPLSKVVNNAVELLKEPGKVLTKFFNHADNFLFKLVFGGDLGSDKSILKVAMDKLQGVFATFANWLNDSIFVPMHDALFGDNGIITQIKQSQFVQDMKAKFENAKVAMMGTKVDGKYTGGILSETINQLGVAGGYIKEALIGKDNSVLSSIKSVASSGIDRMSHFFGLDTKDNDTDTKPTLKETLDNVWTSIKDNAHIFSDHIFGEKGTSRRDTYEAFKKDFASNEAKGKLGAGAIIGGAAAAFLGGKVGLISSLFLPGGAIGGALLGIGIAATTQSETLQKVLFGEKAVDEDGVERRQGGVISKSIVDYVSKNKKGLIGGAFVGLASSMGILPAMLMPGGPVGGALVGSALQMAWNSDSFQTFLYGDTDANGNRTGDGFMSKISDAMDDTQLGKKVLRAGIGAGVGFLGSFLLPGGPILNAMMGAAASLTLGSERFKNWLFGTYDETTGKRADDGFLKRTSEFIFGPLRKGFLDVQDSMMGMVERAIIIPVQASLGPIVNEIGKIGVAVKDTIIGFSKGLMNIIKDQLFSGEGLGKILKPIIDTSKVIGKGIYKVTETIISAPFNALAAFAEAIDLKNRIKGVYDRTLGVVVKGIGNLITSATKAVLDTARQAASTLMGGIFRIVSAPFKLLGGAIGKLFGGRDHSEDKGKEGSFSQRFKESFRRRMGQDKDAPYSSNRHLMTVFEQIRANRKESRAYEDYKKKARKNKEPIMSRKEFDAQHKFANWTNSKFTAQRAEITASNVVVNANSATTPQRPSTSTPSTPVSSDNNAPDTSIIKQPKFNDKYSKDQKRYIDDIYDNGGKFHEKQYKRLGLTEDSIAEYIVNKHHRDKFKDSLKDKDSDRISLLDLIREQKEILFPKINRPSIPSYVGLERNHEEQSRKATKFLSGVQKVFVVGGYLDKIGRNPLNGMDINGLGKIGKIGKKSIREQLEDTFKGGKASGGEVEETGLYTLTEGETVIPSSTVSVNDSINREEQVAESIFGKLKNKFKEGYNEQRQAHETKVNNFNKSYEAMLAKQQAEQEKQEERSFRSKVLEHLASVSQDTKEHKFDWQKIFSKKGLITMALVALSPILLEFAQNVIDFFNGTAGNWISDTLNSIKFGLDSVGGLSGAADKLAGVADSVSNIFKPEGSNENNNNYGDNKLGDRLTEFMFGGRNEDGSLKYDHMTDSKFRLLGTLLTEKNKKGVSILDNAVSTVGKGVNKVKPVAKTVARKVVRGIDDVRGFMALVKEFGYDTVVNELFPNIKGGTKAIGKAAYDLVSEPISNTMNKAVGKLGNVAKGVGSGVGKIANVNSDIIRHTKDITSAIGNDIKSTKLGGAVVDGITTFTNKAVNNVKLAGFNIKSMKDTVVDKLTAEIDDFKYVIDDVSKYIAEDISKLTKPIKQLGDNVLNSIGKVVDDVGTRFKNISGAVTKGGQALYNTAKDVVTTRVVNPAKTGAKAIKSGASMVTDSTKSFVNYKVIKPITEGRQRANTEYMYKKLFDQIDGKVTLGDKFRQSKIGGKIDDIGKSVKGVATRATTAVKNSGTAKAVTKVGTEIATNVASNPIVSKAVSFCDDAIQWLTKQFTKLAQKFGGKSLGQTVTTFLKSVKNVLKPSTLSKYAGRFAQFIGKHLNIIITAAMGIYGLIDGASSAANLFQVDDSAVDGKMRAISAVYKAAANLSLIGGIIDIINEIVFEVMGVNFIRELAVLVYNSISSQEEEQALTEATKKFRDEYTQKVQDEYDAFLESDESKKEENMVMGENGELRQMTKEEFIQSGRATSFADYNNEKHQTLGKKISTGLKNTKNKLSNLFTKDSQTGTKVKLGTVFTKDYWKVNETDAEGNLLSEAEIQAEKNKKLLMLPVTLLKGTFNTVGDAFSGLIKSIKTTITDFGENTKTAFSSITGISSLVNGDFFTPPQVEDTEAGALSKIGFYLNRYIMFLPGLVVGTVKTALKGVNTLWSKVKSAITMIKDDSESAFSSITGMSSVFKGDYWTAPTDDNDNPMSPLRRVVFYGSRLLTMIPAFVIGAMKDVGKIFSPIITPIKNLITSKFDLDGPAPTDSNDPNGIGNMNKFIYYGAKVLEYPAKAITFVASGLGKVFGPILKGTGKIIGAMAEDLITGAEVVKHPLSFLSSDYWKIPEGDPDNPMSLLRKIMFFGNRIVSTPVMSVIGLVKQAFSALGPIFDGVVAVSKAIVTDITTLVSTSDNPLSVFSGDYWSYKDNVGSDFGLFRGLMFYTGRLIMSPASIVIGSIKSIGEKLKPLFTTLGTVMPLIASDLEGTFDFSNIKGVTSILSEGYFDFPGSQNSEGLSGGASTFRWLMFMLGRGIGAIPRALVGLFSSGKNLITAISGGVSGINTAITEAWNTDGVSLGQGYFKVPDKIKNSGMFSGFSEVLFVIGRLFAAIPKFFDSIFEKGASAINAIKNFFSAGFGEIDDINTKTITINTNDDIQLKSKKLQTGLKPPNIPNIGGYGEPDLHNGFPYYSQNDPSVKQKSFKVSRGHTTNIDETMGARGCGPTAMAMVASKLKGGYGVNPYTPENMAQLATDSGYSTDAGTVPQYFTDIGNRLGMDVSTEQTNPLNIKYHLQSGQPIILQGKSDDVGSPYTSAGHYVVATGLDKNGNILINDPRGKRYSKSYPIDNVAKDSFRMWSFSNGGLGPKTTAITIDGSENIGNSQQKAIAALVAKAESYVGYKEKSSNNNLDDFSANSGNKNYTKFARDYGKYAGGSWNPNPWCAMFVSVCFVEVFGEKQAKQMLGGKLFAQCQAWYNTFKSKGWYFTTPKVGDLVFFNNSEKRSKETGRQIGHVGIVVGVSGRTITVVEGNAGGKGSNVDGVYKNTYNIDGTYVNGFGRPAYAGIAPVNASSPSTNKSTTNSSVTTTNTVNTTNTTRPTSFAGVLSQLAEGIVKPIQTFLYGADEDRTLYGENIDSSQRNTNNTTVATKGDRIGKYVAQFESGSKGPAMISSGNGDHGGASFGTYQFPSFGKTVADKDTPLYKFWKKYYARKYPESQPGNNPGFKQVWTHEATTNPEQFQANEHSYMMENYYKPMKKRISSVLNPDTHSRAAQESVWSTAVQYGPNSKVILKALDNKNSQSLSGTDLVNKIQDYKVRNIGNNFRSSSKAVQDGVRKRHDKREREVLLSIANQPAISGGLGDIDKTLLTPNYETTKDITPMTSKNVKGKPVVNRNTSGAIRYNSMHESINKSEKIEKQLGGYGSNSEMISILSQMLVELQGTNSGINKFNEKEFTVNQTPVLYSDNSSQNTIVNAGGKQQKKSVKPENTFLGGDIYKTAKMISSGIPVT